MRQFHRSTIAALAGLGALAIAIAPGFAAGGHQGARDTGPVQGTVAQDQLAHMGQGGGGAQGHGGPGMMGRGSGPGYGAGPGCGMGPGYGMGPGMMGSGMMGQGQGHGSGSGYGMGSGMMGSGSGNGQGYGGQVVLSKDLTIDDVRHFLEHRVEMHGNKRVKVGDVTETDDDTITADIVTQDGSVAQRFKVDRHSGQMQQAE